MGVLVAWREKQRRWVMFCVVGGLLALLWSGVLNVEFGSWQPYALLRTYVPGFGQLRSPFRFGVVVQVLLVGLAGFGLARWRLQRRWLRLLAACAICIGMLEVVALPLRLYRVPASAFQDDWITWLGTQPPGAAAMVPFASGSRARDFEPTTIAMLQALAHGHPLANGYSGFFPPAHNRLRRAMRQFPDSRSHAALVRAGVVYVVIERDWLTERRRAALDSPQFGFELRFVGDEKVVYTVASQPQR